MQPPFSLVLASVFAVSLSGGSAFAGQNATAMITGRITAPDKNVLPGAEITATRQEDRKVAKGWTDEKGTYSIGGLSQGDYVISAEKYGFAKANFGPVRLLDGDRIVVDLQMRMPPVEHVDYVAESPSSLDRILATSESVVYLRINEIEPIREWHITETSPSLGALVHVQTIETIKLNPSHGPSHATFVFLHLGATIPYKVGKRYIAFLIWDERDRVFVPQAGDHYMIEIDRDRVAKTADLKGVEAGMPVANVLARLRSLAKSSRQEDSERNVGFSYEWHLHSKALERVLPAPVLHALVT